MKQQLDQNEITRESLWENRTESNSRKTKWGEVERVAILRRHSLCYLPLSAIVLVRLGSPKIMVLKPRL